MIGPKRRIRTVAELPVPAEALWAVLTDFDSYAEWNPLNLRARGEARLGARVEMTFVNAARPGSAIDQVVTITALEPCRRLAWRGRIPLLFEGNHYFELTPTEGGTRLVHGETMSGLVPLTFSEDVLANAFVPLYEATNRALAERAVRLA